MTYLEPGNLGRGETGKLARSFGRWPSGLLPKRLEKLSAARPMGQRAASLPGYGAKVGLVVAVAFVFAWSTWGCYTALRHPVLKGSLTGEDETTVVSFGDDCWQCHSSRQEIFWPNESAVTTGGYADWDFFYATPWWIDDFYYSQRPTEQAGGRLPEPRRFRSRGQPTVVGAPAISTPAGGTSIVARKRAEPGSVGSAPLAPTDSRRRIGRRGSGENQAAGSRQVRRQIRQKKEE